jgi:hypothetical protein
MVEGDGEALAELANTCLMVIYLGKRIHLPEKCNKYIYIKPLVLQRSLNLPEL